MIAAFLSLNWLVLIFVDRTWWQLAIWPFAVLLGVGGWTIVPVRPRVEDDSVEEGGD